MSQDYLEFLYSLHDYLKTILSDVQKLKCFIQKLKIILGEFSSFRSAQG